MAPSLGGTRGAGRARGSAVPAAPTAGLYVHTAFAALGLSALLAASATAFTALKWVGAAYLVWLAVRTVCNSDIAPAASTSGHGKPVRPAATAS